MRFLFTTSWASRAEFTSCVSLTALAYTGRFTFRVTRSSAITSVLLIISLGVFLSPVRGGSPVHTPSFRSSFFIIWLTSRCYWFQIDSSTLAVFYALDFYSPHRLCISYSVAALVVGAFVRGGSRGSGVRAGVVTVVLLASGRYSLAVFSYASDLLRLLLILWPVLPTSYIFAVQVISARGVHISGSGA